MEQWSLSANKDILAMASGPSHPDPHLLYQNLYQYGAPVATSNGLSSWKVCTFLRQVFSV